MNISISHAYGFSRVGFFGPGNDLGLMLLMINCLVCYMFLHTSKIRYAVANIVITAVTILIGTVAGIFGSMFIIVCLLLSKYFIKNYNRITKKWQRVYFASIFFIFVPVIIKLIDFIIHYDTYSIRKFSLERLVSGEARNGLKYAVQSYMNTYNIFDYVFGKGISNVWYNVAIILNLNKESRAIELDQYELLSSYGVLFGGILLLCPILLAVYFIKKYIKYQTLFYFWSSIAMALFVFHGFNAGHAYTSVMAMLVVTVFFFSREKILYIQKKQRKYGIL
jgi:hypothetical protein